MTSRLKMTAKNAFWSYFSMIISLGIQFVSRTIFIFCLGEEYLGINGLFSNILGVLSFAELGIGTAINFSLYKPVADHDIEKIKAYMHYYKWAYRIIAGIVAVLGIAIIPLLDILVKNPGNVGDIRIYYCIYLFNTTTSYLVSYKYSLTNAEQKSYIYTKMNLIIQIVTTVTQIIVLLVWKSFLAYLLVAAIVGVLQKIFIHHYFNKLYPYLQEEKSYELSKKEKQVLVTKIKALVIHKIGDVSVHQTDNIIVSAFISTKVVGILSNYNLLINTVSSCINVLFNSVTGSLGNMIAIESKEYQYKIFKKYRFIGFWLYGFSAIALVVLMNPFITLWVGEKLTVDGLVVGLLVVDYYMIGQRICLNNMKSAAGMYEADKYVALLQAFVNLVASIMLVKLIGLPGVFIGTILQGLISTILKPILTYKSLFNVSSIYYFIDSIKYVSAVLFAYLICRELSSYILEVVTVYRFLIMIVVVVCVPNILFWVVFRKTEEFEYLLELLRRMLNNCVVKK